jgi:hypothetical protein
VVSSGQARYVRLTVSLRQTQDDLIQQVGHELVHATEIAAATHVESSDGLRRYYRAIGTPACGSRCGFETEAAVRATGIIRGELLGSPASRAQAQHSDQRSSWTSW